MENESEWEQKFAEGFTDLIIKALAEREKKRYPELKMKDIEKQIKSLSLGELAISLSRKK